MSTIRADAAAVGVVLGMLSAACGATDSVEVADARLRVGVPVPVLSAGGANSVGLTFTKTALTRETLVTMTANGRAAPRILESWEVSGDGLTWLFKVRSGVRFHDGTPLTAGELAPQVARQLAAASLGSVKAVTAEDHERLRITLNEPYAFLFEDLRFISALRKVGDNTFDTGPYIAAEESATRLVLKAVPDHYRGQPEVDEVVVELYPDQRNAWSALMTDKIDMLYEVSHEALDFVRRESSVTLATFPRPYVYLFGFNVKHPSLRDPRVRQALDRGVDRHALVRMAMSGEGEPAYGHVWPRHWAYDAKAATVPYEPQAARQLLQEAGLELRSEPGRMPARLRIKCLVHEPLRELALVLQRQLADIDVDLVLEVPPAAQLLARLGNGDFEAFVFEMLSAQTFKFPYQFWHSQSPMVKHGYAGADDALSRVRRARNDVEFQTAASDFQRRVHEDPPAVFLAWGRTTRAVSKRFEIPPSDEDVYHTIPRWKPVGRADN